MIYLYFTEFSKPLSETKYQELIELLPPAFAEKIGRLKRWQDAHTSLLGKIFLLEGLKKMGYDHKILEHINYNDYGRPYLDSPIDFNISHSKNAVVCAISEQRIGVDIEKVASINLKDFKRFLTEDEWGTIHSSCSPTIAFYELWTKKEAIIKAVGEGLSIPLKEIFINDNIGIYQGQNWCLQKVFVNQNYILTIASKIKDEVVVFNHDS